MDIVLKCLYFFSGFSSASGPLYLPLYLDQHLSLKKEEIGILLSISPVISLFSTPLLTWLGEHKIGLKYMTILCGLAGLITFDLYSLIPQSHSFLLIIVVCIINALLASPLGTLLDSLTLLLSTDYGKQRLWCSISWGLGSLLTGVGVDYFGPDFLFGLFTLSSLVFLILLIRLPRVSTGTDEDKSVHKSESLDENLDNDRTEEEHLLDENNDNTDEKTLINVLREFSTVLFLCSITLIGMVFSLIQSFLFIFMSQGLQISPSLIGITTPISILFELPVFYYSELIIRGFGTGMMIILAHVLLIFRLLIYMILNEHSAFFIIPVEIIHGLAFALTWTAGIAFSNVIAPDSSKSTFIAIYCTLYNNVGGFLGTYVGGKIYEDYGHYYLWAFCIILLLISALLFLISLSLSNRSGDRVSKRLCDDGH